MKEVMPQIWTILSLFFYRDQSSILEGWPVFHFGRILEIAYIRDRLVTPFPTSYQDELDNWAREP